MSTVPNPPSPITPPLTRFARVALADRVARAFPPLACVRGFRYFARKRVDLVAVGDSAIDAAVKGTRVQRVQLRVADGRLAAGCTCCAKLLGPAACRHVWATILEVDRRGAFESLRNTSRALALSPVDRASATAKSRKPGQPRPKRRTAS